MDWFLLGRDSSVLREGQCHTWRSMSYKVKTKIPLDLSASHCRWEETYWLKDSKRLRSCRNRRKKPTDSRLSSIRRLLNNNTMNYLWLNWPGHNNNFHEWNLILKSGRGYVVSIPYNLFRGVHPLLRDYHLISVLQPFVFMNYEPNHPCNLLLSCDRCVKYFNQQSVLPYF